MLYLDLASGECSAVWEIGGDAFQLARAMAVSADGLFLLMADQASPVSAKEGDEYQALKMFYRATGLGVSLQRLASSGAAEAIQLRNVVDLAVQGADPLSPSSVLQPRRILALQVRPPERGSPGDCFFRSEFQTVFVARTTKRVCAGVLY